MRSPLLAALAVTTLSLGLPSASSAQASAFIPLDDPVLPRVEHLIMRGGLEDPTPMVRPFRRLDLVRSLRKADTTSAEIRDLLARYDDEGQPASLPSDADAIRVRYGARAGLQAGTQARRDLLHLGGDGGAWEYAEVRAEFAWRPIIMVARTGFENRARRDPDWPGRRDNYFTGRVFEGYASVQTGPVRLSYGQFERNWGPPGLPGLPISNVSYRRDGLALDVVSRRIQFHAYASQLADDRDSTGQLVKRYFQTKRLAVRLSPRLQVGLWESTILQGVDRSFEAAFSNPFTFAYAALTYGYGDRGVNNMLGADVTWRYATRHTLSGQFALDDFWYEQRDRNRDRFGFTVRGTGPLGRGASYAATYSLVSSLALRAFVPQENFTDGGVGLGRNFTDNDWATVQIGIPVRTRWLLTPELTVFRQGEGNVRTPYPARPVDPARFPTLFIGTVERTLRTAVGISGEQGGIQLNGNLGLHAVRGADNVPGRNVTRVVARVQATLGVSANRWLQ